MHFYLYPIYKEFISLSLNPQFYIYNYVYNQNIWNKSYESQISMTLDIYIYSIAYTKKI